MRWRNSGHWGCGGGGGVETVDVKIGKATITHGNRKKTAVQNYSKGTDVSYKKKLSKSGDGNLKTLQV